MEKNNLNMNEEEHKSSGKLAAWLISFVVIFGIITAIFTMNLGNSSGEKSELEVSGTSMSVSYSEYLGYSAKITGIAKNVTGKNLSYASVEFSVYDANGNNLGTAIANVNNLGKGDTWRFEATLFDFPSTKPVTYKLVDIITW